MKLFAAIKIPQDIAPLLEREQKGVSGARWSAPEKFHITLGYFGEVSDEQAEMLDDELARLSMPAFDITIKGAGHFGSTDPHAIWVGVEENMHLIRLNEHCKNAARRAGIQMEKRNYLPHVTLAYLKPFSPIDRVIDFEQRLAGLKLGPFLADEYSLFSSLPKARGANIYREEASYPLLGR